MLPINEISFFGPHIIEMDHISRPKKFETPQPHMPLSGYLGISIANVAESKRSPLASHEAARVQTLFSDYLGQYQ